MLLNMLNDLTEAMKALDGKKQNRSRILSAKNWFQQLHIVDEKPTYCVQNLQPLLKASESINSGQFGLKQQKTRIPRCSSSTTTSKFTSS